LEWQELCKNTYEELKVSLAQEQAEIDLEPKKVRHPKSGGVLEIFNQILVYLGGATALGAGLKYLLDKVVEIQKERRETERAREIEIKVKENSFRFKGIAPGEVGEVVQQVERVLKTLSAQSLPEEEHD